MVSMQFLRFNECACFIDFEVYIEFIKKLMTTAKLILTKRGVTHL